MRRPFAPLLLLAATAAGCLSPRPATVPLRTVAFQHHGAAPRCLVVLLPGRGDRPEDFGRLGFTGELARQGLSADVVAVDAHLGYYFERTIVERLHEDVVLPARARGVEQVWFAGISLGGTGSILYAAQHPGELSGMLLLAPFLGDRPVVDEIVAAGGLAGGTVPEPRGERDFQRRLWRWLEGYEGAAGDRPPLWLGYGEGDGFARANRLLEQVLPPERVLTTEGGHTWRAWRRLWEGFLERGALSSCGDPEAARVDPGTERRIIEHQRKQLLEARSP